MVTRGSVVEVISPHEVKIQVPKFGLIQEEPDEKQVNELPNARLCTIPGCLPNLKKGDTVLISIEDNNLNDVMIMRTLIPDNNSVGTSSAYFSDLKVETKVTLPKNTSIGDVTSDNLFTLKGVNSNIQTQFDDNKSQKIELLDWLTMNLNNFTL